MKILFIFIMYCLRPIWNILFNIFYVSFYSVLYVIDPVKRIIYKANKSSYDSIKCLSELIYYMKFKWSYKYDGVKGIADHDNTPIEFFTKMGSDCEDVAIYAKKKLKVFGYKPVKIFMKGKGLTSSHMDCYFEMDGKGFLFNYGYLMEGKNLDECMKRLGENWITYKDAIYFKYYL